MNDAKLSAGHVDEIDAVREVILDYVRGIHSGDTGLLTAIFHPDARMYGFSMVTLPTFRSVSSSTW